MEKFDSIKFVKQMISFSPRQLKGEISAKNLILETLQKYGIGFDIQNFNVDIPVYEKYYLKADGKDIKCHPTALKSGRITSKENIISSLVFSFDSIGTPNINFNPFCPAISLPNFYFTPSIAIEPKDLPIILSAEKIDGLVKIKKQKHKSANILVGNIKNPRNIAFAHYDGFTKGAADNASGVATSLEVIIENRDILKDNLFVFAGAEELSFDNPTYWGHGFRVFEESYGKIINKAKNIIIVDVIGTKNPELVTDTEKIFLFFPVVGFKKIIKKILVLSAADDFEKFMRIYHSELDDVSKLDKKYLDSTVKKIIKLINR